MRLALALVLSTAACVSPSRVLVPSDAPIGRTNDGPPLVIGDRERSNAESPFSSDAVVPCRDEEDRAGARKALQSLSAEISSLDETSPDAFHRLEERLKRILDTPCFELAKADLRDEPIELDSGLAFRTWWFEDGGESSLMRRVAAGDDDGAMVELPGEPRPSLLATGHEDHPLAPLLCPPSDRWDCARETQGWIRRAEAPFKLAALEREKTDCEKVSRESPPEERWSALVECNLSHAPRETALPLGYFRAMKEGYFVITQPPYGSCGSLDVFDLATGTAIRASSCGPGTPILGRVPLATLREAAWMTALAPYAKDQVRAAVAFPLPEHVVPGRTRENAESRSIRLGRIHAGGRPSTWTWYRPKNGRLVAQVTGTMRGGGSWTAASYAQDLMRMVQDTFVAGCAPSFSGASLASIPWNQTGPMAVESMTMPFDFQASALIAARREIPKVKTPAKCPEPM